MRLKWSELFDGWRFSARCQQLSGRTVEIAGFVVDSHDGCARLLVAEPGGCPDCSPEPVAAVMLPDFCMKTDGSAITLRGRLSYGFVVDGQGKASFLRLEGARIATGLPT